MLILLFSGFIRDYCMININHVLKHLTDGIYDYAMPSFYFLENWSIGDIIKLKWFLTVFFFVYFWLISFVTLYIYFKPNTSIKAISYVYAALICLAGAFYLIGWLFSIKDTMYHVVRTLTGLTHSFMPAMVVFLFLKYFPTQKID